MKKLTRREKILLGVSIVGIGVVGYFGYKYNINIDNLKNRLDESNIIALRSLNREKQGSIFEIKQFKDYINNLNPDININRFVNIPEAESRIKELELFINEIDLDMDRIYAKITSALMKGKKFIGVNTTSLWRV